MLLMRLEEEENKAWRFGFQEPKLLFTIAVSVELKTLSTIIKAFISSTTAIFKVLWISSSALPGPFTRFSFLSNSFSFINLQCLPCFQMLVIVIQYVKLNHFFFFFLNSSFIIDSLIQIYNFLPLFINYYFQFHKFSLTKLKCIFHF